MYRYRHFSPLKLQSALSLSLYSFIFQVCSVLKTRASHNLQLLEKETLNLQLNAQCTSSTYRYV
jgi:hypothetical protein